MTPSERLNDPEEAQRAALDGRQARIRTAAPGIVAAVNLQAQTVSVQLAIQGSVEGPDGATVAVNMPLLVDVPLVWPRGGGFAITFPVQAGDEVLVVYGDRCIDSWWQSGGIGAPLVPRMHDLSDAFAILAPTSQPKRLVNVYALGLEIRTTGGGSYIRMDRDGAVSIVSPSLTHNGVNIGSTHVHGGVAPGGANTLPPT